MNDRFSSFSRLMSFNFSLHAGSGFFCLVFASILFANVSIVLVGCRPHIAKSKRVQQIDLYYPGGEILLCQMRSIEFKKDGFEIWYNSKGEEIVRGEYQKGEPFSGMFISISKNDKVLLLTFKDRKLIRTTDASELRHLVELFEGRRVELRDAGIPMADYFDVLNQSNSFSD